MEAQVLQREEKRATATAWLGGNTPLRVRAPAVAREIADIIDERMPRNAEDQQEERAQLSAE